MMLIPLYDDESVLTVPTVTEAEMLQLQAQRIGALAYRVQELEHLLHTVNVDLLSAVLNLEGSTVRTVHPSPVLAACGLRRIQRLIARYL